MAHYRPPMLGDGPYRSAATYVGEGYSVEFTFIEAGVLGVEWSPRLPFDRRELLPAYRAPRDAFLVLLGEELVITIGVVEA